MTTLKDRLENQAVPTSLPRVAVYGFTAARGRPRPALPVARCVPRAFSHVVRDREATMGVLDLYVERWPDPEDWAVLLGRVADLVLLDYDVAWMEARPVSTRRLVRPADPSHRDDVVFWATRNRRSRVPALHELCEVIDPDDLASLSCLLTHPASARSALEAAGTLG